MRPRSEILKNPRLKKLPGSLGFDACEIRTRDGVVQVLFGEDEEGWEHVSVSPKGSKRRSPRCVLTRGCNTTGSTMRKRGFV